MKLDREQIIKALECCSAKGLSKCYSCPIKSNGAFCSYKLNEDARKLIKQLIEENEKLHASCTEVARVQADTVRTFAERLKAQKMKHKKFGELVCVEDIDEIAEEMLRCDE